MKSTKAHITFLLVLAFAFSAFAGEKSIKLGAGYNAFKLVSHDSYLHSGRYFYGGFNNSFGKNEQHFMQFQIANSNRELEIDLPYVSASTDFALNYAYLITVAKNKNSMHQVGPNVSTNAFLNFFPHIDAQNFTWQSQNSIGLRGSHSFKLKANKTFELNYEIPLYSTFTFNKMDRFSGDVPSDRPNITYTGFANTIFNSNVEAGITFNYLGMKWGTFYQLKYNRFGETASDRVINTAQSINLRVFY